MKKNMMEKISSLLLAAAMVFGVSVTAFAAVPTITFRGKDNFEVTSDNLFVDFNNCHARADIPNPAGHF